MAPSKHASGWVDPLLRPVVAASVPAAGVEIRVEPTAQERAALARALGLAEVVSCTGRFRLAARSGGIIAVTGEVVAEVMALCVVTLEPFPLSLREPVEMTFAEPAEEDEPRRRAPSVNTLTAADLLDADDPPDPIENGQIDLGKVTTEFMALALPVYPRAPGAAYVEDSADAEASPFAALSRLKDGGNSPR